MTKHSIISGSDIAVIIPTAGKRPLALRRAIDSVLAQTKKCHQIIVIWDSKNVNCEFLNEYPKVIFLATGIDGSGVAKARNLGLDFAVTSYIALLDDDDFWPSEKIEKYLDVMNSFEKPGFYVSRSSYIDEEDKLVSICPKKKLRWNANLSDYLHTRILPGRKRITLATSTYVFPRVGPKGVFRFDESAKLAEDILLLHDLENYFPFRLISGRPLCFTSLYRKSKTNLSHRPLTFDEWQRFHLQKFLFLPKKHYDNMRAYFGALQLMSDSNCQVKKREFVINILLSEADFTTKISSLFLMFIYKLKVALATGSNRI